MKLLFVAVVFLVNSLCSFADIGFSEGIHFIKVEIKWDKESNDSKDAFTFTLRTVEDDLESLKINKKEVTREQMNNALDDLLREISKIDDDFEKFEKQKLADEFAQMLNASFISDFLVVEYSEALVDLLFSASNEISDPKEKNEAIKKLKEEISKKVEKDSGKTQENILP